MSFHHARTLFAILLIGGILAGCRSNINLNDIDATTEVDLGIALPIGSMKATIGDFIGNVNNIYIDSLNHQGVITWKDTFKIERNYHQVDLSQHVSSKDFYLNVYEKLEAAHLIGANGKVTGTGMPITLHFDVPLRLIGINDSTMHERMDSAYIEKAAFTSVINPQSLPLEWEWIDEVTLDLGPQITRPAGNTMVVYQKGTPNTNYNTSIPTSVDNFSICMMKNRHLDPTKDQLKYATNVIDSCLFGVNFTFTIPAGVEVPVPSSAKFRYDLSVQFIDYKAIWGMFVRSKDMYDESIVDLSKDNWGDMDFILHSNLPFADPKIDMNVVTKVAGALIMQGDYLFAEDVDGNRSYADFNGSRQRYIYFTPDQYLNPITSTIGDSTTNMVVLFDKAPSRGRIDRLFNNMPQKLGYKFNVDFNYQQTPQIRILPHTGIRIEAACTLPLIFNQGVQMEYKDTIDEVNLTQLSIDSLIASTPIDTLSVTDLKIVLKAKSTIPLSLKGTMKCMDENGKIIMDPTLPTQPFNLFTEDTIRLAPPTYAYSLGNWNMTSPGETTIIVSLTQEKLDLIKQIKNIIFTAVIDDKSLEYAYQQGLFNVRITEDASLTLHIGLATHVNAVIDLNTTEGGAQ